MKERLFRYLILFSLLVFYIPVFSENGNNDETASVQKEKGDKPAEEKKSEDELAKVTIFPFEDRTNSPNYQYMSESLGDAINTSMLKEFSYNRVSYKEVKKSKFNMEQEIIQLKLKNKFKPAKIRREAVKKAEDEEKPKDEKTQAAKEKDKKENLDQGKNIKEEKPAEPEFTEQDKEQMTLVKMVAKDLASDIIIFGNYSYDEATNEIVFKVSLYLALSDTIRDLDEMRNPVDNTIFTATKKVAKNLVEEIHNMIDEAEKAAREKEGKKGDTETAEAQPQQKKGEKVALTRKVAMISSLDWTSKRFSVSIQPGFSFNNAPWDLCGVCQIPLSVTGRYWIIPNVYAGLSLDAGRISFGSFPFINEQKGWWTFDAIAFAGYSLPVNAWLFSADAGAGYYVVLDSKIGTIYNPAFGARINAELLLTGNLSLGLSLTARVLYDDPKPVLFGGLGFSVSLVY